MSSRDSTDSRSAAASAGALDLQQAAAALRNVGSSLRYSPAMRLSPESAAGPRLTPEIDDALSEIERVLRGIQRDADERAAEEAAVLESPAGPHVRRGHAALECALQAVIAGIDSLRRALEVGEEASLDAPYGRSAPSGVHPGALCATVADRAEALALAARAVAVLKANLARAGQSAPSGRK